MERENRALQRNLLALRVAVAILVGALAGGLLDGWTGACVIPIIGVIVALQPHPALTAILGAFAGGMIGGHSPLPPGIAREVTFLLGCVAGLGLGLCFGDWRISRSS